MRNLSLVLVILLFFGIGLCGTAWAHQPRLITGDEVVTIENPEVSQAFYGELTGKPAYYQIISNEPFNLYTGILVPDVPGVDQDVSVEVTYKPLNHSHDIDSGEHEHKEIVVVLDGTDFDWEHYWEEFAGDWYYSGPEYRANPAEAEALPQGVLSEPGIYTFKVYSPDNQGKYVLVVGPKEEFTFSEIVKTYRDLPALKKYFEKSPWTAYFNIVGIFLFAFIALIILVIWLTIFLVKRRRRKDNT